MEKIVHNLGLDVHKETMVVAIAPEKASEVRAYGIIGGTLETVVSRPVRRTSSAQCFFAFYRWLRPWRGLAAG